MSKKGRSKGEKPEMEMDPVQMANEELRAKLTSIQIEFQQERARWEGRGPPGSGEGWAVNSWWTDCPGRVSPGLDIPPL